MGESQLRNAQSSTSSNKGRTAMWEVSWSDFPWSPPKTPIKPKSISGHIHGLHIHYFIFRHKPFIQIPHPFGPKCVPPHPIMCDDSMEDSWWVPHHYPHIFKAWFSSIYTINDEWRVLRHNMFTGWLLAETIGILWWQIPIWYYFYSLYVLGVFQFLINPVDMQMVVVPFSAYLQSWSIVYM